MTTATLTKSQEIAKKYGRTANDTGSPEVQIALLTSRIEHLAPHFASHKHDYSSNRGLMKMIGQRKSLLRYLQIKDTTRYNKLIQSLGLRK
jgi:small subunit ribosomal protein S15